MPTEQLAHVDGTPREAFVPADVVNTLGVDAGESDAVLARGVDIDTRLSRR